MERSDSCKSRSAVTVATTTDSTTSEEGCFMKRVHFAQQDNMSTRSSSKGTVRLPVVVVPADLTFIANDPSSHKQTVSIYNPYDFHIKYKVFGTAPTKYQMPDDHGSISPCTYKDVTIRMTEITDSNVGVIDKFRIVIWDLASSVDHMQGERELRSILVASKESIPCAETHGRSGRHPLRHSVAKHTSTVPATVLPHVTENDGGTNKKQGPSVFVLLVTIVCIGALSAPNSKADCNTRGDTQWIASYITLSLSQKLVAAYILGLVTVTLFRSC